MGQQFRWLKTGDMSAIYDAELGCVCACLWQLTFIVVGGLKHRPTFLDLLHALQLVRKLLQVQGHFCSLWQVELVLVRANARALLSRSFGNWMLVSSP